MQLDLSQTYFATPIIHVVATLDNSCYSTPCNDLTHQTVYIDAVTAGGAVLISNFNWLMQLNQLQLEGAYNSGGRGNTVLYIYNCYWLVNETPLGGGGGGGGGGGE